MKGFQDLNGLNVLVVGLGVSGKALIRFLCKKGASVTVTDQADAQQLGSDLKQFLGMGVRFELGGHCGETFQKSDLIVISPGVPCTISPLVDAKEKGIRIIGEMELAYGFISEPIIGITGTNGKTTTTAVIGEMLRCSGKRVFVGGNIGNPLINYVQENEKSDVVVAEVSSFQLDTTELFRPKVGALLNITPDHLDRYADLTAYADAKGKLFKNQTETDIAVLNGTDDLVQTTTKKIRSRRLIFGNPDGSEEGAWISRRSVRVSLFQTLTGKGNVSPDRKETIFDLTGTYFRGKYGEENAAAASLAALAAGATPEGIRSALRSFKGLPHRLEEIAVKNGVRYVNDSKATNVHSVICALGSFDEPVILILGGRDKGSDFRALESWIQSHVKSIILMGEAAPLIRSALSRAASISEASGMKEAVFLASRMADPGDVVLLSPGCASFDMFNNYIHRGEAFREVVTKLV
ncbi:MAG: UDP-N-acetylmuramoyl-L-alanine--D-glutamate ligase [Thermodesulfobacteriota bacterium]